MTKPRSRRRTATAPRALHALIVGVVAVVSVTAAAKSSAQTGWHNVDTGAPLRPGLYGRIEVRGSTPPPLVHSKPVVAEGAERLAAQEPVYLYVPPGQLRRWGMHCAKWQACERPVYFVRVDDSPSRLGDWKKTQRAQPPASIVREALDLIASQ